MTKSLRNVYEQWCIGKCREIENAAVINNNSNLCQLIWGSGPRKLDVSGVISGSDDMKCPPWVKVGDRAAVHKLS